MRVGKLQTSTNMCLYVLVGANYALSHELVMANAAAYTGKNGLLVHGVMQHRMACTIHW